MCIRDSIGGTGLMFAIYGRWSRSIGWHAEEAPVLDFRQPDEVRLTPSQKAACLLFATILVLFLLQALVGALTEHYREELTGFFGIDMGQLLPYTVSRTWHLQLSLFWTAGAVSYTHLDVYKRQLSSRSRLLAVGTTAMAPRPEVAAVARAAASTSAQVCSRWPGSTVMTARLATPAATSSINSGPFS